MKLTANQIGMVLHGMYMSDYFKTENLEEALEQLVADEMTTIDVSLPMQPELPHIHTLLEKLDFEKRIPDFNERQITFSIVQDIYGLLQDSTYKKIQERCEMEEFIKIDEVKEIDAEFYEDAEKKRKERKAFEVLGKAYCEDLGLENNQLIILLVNEETPYYESDESTGCVSFLFKYQDKFFKYLYQW